MKEFFGMITEKIAELLGTYIPSLAGALIILVLGWVLALMIAAIVRGLLKKTKLSDRLAEWGGKETEAFNVERLVGRLFFWIVMILVLVAFFQALGLTLIIEPLNSLLTLVFNFAPRLLAAGLILLVAWFLAVILKLAVSKAMLAAKLDERLGELSDLEEEKTPLTKSISNAVYWLIILLFLPAVLNALELGGLLEPVSGMIDKVLLFLPNIFVAFVIMLVGWFLARIIQRMVSNLLAAVGTDKLSKKIGLDSALGKQKLSGVLGLVVYILILIPILVAALNALKLEAITAPASNMLNMILTAAPSIFAAILLLTIAYVVARWLTGLITNLLSGAGFDNIMVKIGLVKEPEEGKWSPSGIVGYVVLVAVMIFATIEALKLVEFTSLADLLTKFLVLAGNVALGLIIFAVGFYLANLAGKAISTANKAYSGLLSTVTRVAIMVLAGAMALNQMGLADEIITLAFGIVLGALAVAFAIAFGIGGREIAAKKIEEWLKSVESKKSSRK